MKTSPEIAVIGATDDPLAEALRRELGAPDAAAWFAPRDVHDVDAAVRDGAVRRVVFLHLADFATAVVDEHIAAHAWLARAAQVAIREPAACPPELPHALLAAAAAARRRRAGARALSGAVLSLVAVTMAFIVLWLARASLR